MVEHPGRDSPLPSPLSGAPGQIPGLGSPGFTRLKKRSLPPSGLQSLCAPALPAELPELPKDYGRGGQ